MKRRIENAAFQCGNCGAKIEPLTNGSFRNHCPVCLYSKHMDNFPGDRASECKGLMKPIGLDYSGKKGYQLIHQCTKCQKVGRNKVAINTIQADNLIQFMTEIG